MFFERFLPLKTVQKITSLSHDHLRKAVEEGEFPAPVQLTRRRYAWKASDVIDWIETRETPVDG